MLTPQYSPPVTATICTLYTRALVRELGEIAVDDPISTPNCTLDLAHGNLGQGHTVIKSRSSLGRVRI